MSETQHRRCHHCSAIIVEARGSRAKYCSDTCKQRAYEARRVGDGLSKAAERDPERSAVLGHSDLALSAELLETLQAVAWVAERDGCSWTAAVSQFLERDSSIALEELVDRGLLHYVNTQAEERVYVLTTEGRAALKAAA